MPAKYLPTQDRLLVLRDPAPTIDPNPPHLEIPLGQREKYRPNTGLVVKVGPGRRYDDGQVYPLAVKEGQKVMFAHSDTLTKVEHDGQEHLLMQEKDVFLVLDEPAKRPETANDGAITPFAITERGTLGFVLESAKERGQKGDSVSVILPNATA